MGAETFYFVVAGTDVEAAYTDAVDRALRENGHSSYSGTIATTSGVVLAHPNRVFTAQEARDFVLGTQTERDAFHSYHNASREWWESERAALRDSGKEPPSTWLADKTKEHNKRFGKEPEWPGDIDNTVKRGPAIALRLLKPDGTPGFMFYGTASC